MSNKFEEAVKKYREKKGKKTRRSRKKKTTRRHSSYWDGDVLTVRQGETRDSHSFLMKLAAHQRAVGNFVQILTGKNIPVRYPENGDSYTDGKSVTIGATIDEQGFDSTVGLALHEASHILYSDFNLFAEIAGNPVNGTPSKVRSYVESELIDLLVKKNFPINYIAKILKDLLNYVEDRWIDSKSFQAAPGYRPYYSAMYDRYWDSEEISKALSGDYGTDTKISSYMFRIINLTNPESDLEALPGLEEIWKILDLGNILRIQSTKDSLEIAIKILEVIAENVDELEVVDGEAQVPSNHFIPGYPDKVQKSSGSSEDSEDDSESGESEESDGEGAGSGEDGEESDDSDSNGAGSGSDEDGEDSESDGSGSDEDGEEAGDSEGDGDEDDTENERMSKREEKKLKKAVESQRDLLRGEISKKNISQKAKGQLDAMSEAGTEIINVGDRTSGDNATDQRKFGYGEDFGVGSYEAILVKKLTDGLVAAGLCPLFVTSYSGDMVGGSKLGKDRNAAKGVKRGKILGQALVKKIKIRSEDRVTKYSRLRKGKIDPRLISELGCGSESVFYQTLTDTYTDAALHISIDASGSMSGQKWEDSIMVASALAYVATKTEGLEVVIDFRCTTGNSYYSTNSQPYILIAFDSRVDHFTKIEKYFPYVGPHSATPEGLCFEAIMGYIQESTTEQDSFFLNLSDGAPYFLGYNGESAWNHTRRMMTAFRRRGIEVLSYFIGNKSDSAYGNESAFRTMYGKSAKFIDVSSVGQIAKTMNDLFLTKGKKQV